MNWQRLLLTTLLLLSPVAIWAQNPNTWTAIIQQRVNRATTDYIWTGSNYVTAAKPPLAEFSVFVTNINENVTVLFPTVAAPNALTNRLNAEVLAELARRGIPTQGKSLAFQKARLP